MKYLYLQIGLVIASLTGPAFAKDYKGRPYHRRADDAVKVLPASRLPKSRSEFDLKMSPFMGANNFITVMRGIENFEDVVLKKGLHRRKGFGYHILRVLKQMFVYDIVASWSTVAQHEVFGHGYRIRDLGSDVATVTKYQLGLASGYTLFNFKPGITLSQNLAITIGGIESNYILARDMKKQWVSNGKTYGREGALFRLNTLMSFFYSTSSKSFSSLPVFQYKPDHESSHDLLRYIGLINMAYPQKQLTRGRVDGLMWLNFLDPLLYFSYIADMRYLSSGIDSIKIPMFRVKSFRFLPNWRVELAPYGPEHYLEVFSTYKNRFLYLYGRGGSFGPNAYFGAGFDIHDLVTSKTLSLDAKFEAWRQPKMALKLFEAIPSSSLFGLLGSLTANYSFRTLGAFIELGSKTEGYAPGQSLKNAVIFRFGLNVKY